MRIRGDNVCSVENMIFFFSFLFFLELLAARIHSRKLRFNVFYPPTIPFSASKKWTFFQLWNKRFISIHQILLQSIRIKYLHNTRSIHFYKSGDQDISYVSHLRDTSWHTDDPDSRGTAQIFYVGCLKTNHCWFSQLSTSVRAAIFKVFIFVFCKQSLLQRVTIVKWKMQLNRILTFNNKVEAHIVFYNVR
jgi:hypothetical protein